MKILSNKKYNDLISKQFRGIFADVNDDNLLRENGLLYGENKELKQEIERLNNIINELEKLLNYDINKAQEYMNKFIGEEQGNYPVHYYRAEWQKEKATIYLDKIQELKGDGSNE